MDWDWDCVQEKRPTIDVTIRCTETKDQLASVHGLPIDSKVSFLLECICRESGLPCRPSLQWNGAICLPWETIEELGVPTGAEIPCICHQALVTASHDGVAKIWNMESGECETTLAGHNGKVLAACFSPNGRLVVTASEDKTAKVWSTLSGKCERTLSHSDAVYSATFSRDGRFVVSASEDRTAKVWVIKTGECRQTLRGHTLAVYSAMFTVDDLQVMTESRDGTTRLWNPHTGVCDRTLEEQSEIYAASYSPCGRLVATCPGDCTALVLSASTGEVELSLMGHEDLVIAAKYCPQRPKPEPPKKKENASGIDWKKDTTNNNEAEPEAEEDM